MWFRYFITFLDIMICLLAFLATRNAKNKSVVIGYAVILFSYVSSICLMWK